jgi:hypothetical protein
MSVWQNAEEGILEEDLDLDELVRRGRNETWAKMER